GLRARQDEPADRRARRHVPGHPVPIRVARTDGVQRPAPGGGPLQGALDQGQGPCRRPGGGAHEEALPWPGPGAQVRLAPLTSSLGRDYRCKTGQQVSLLSLSREGRVLVASTGSTQHVALIQRGVRLGAGKLWYDQPRTQCSLLVSLPVAVADP